MTGKTHDEQPSTDNSDAFLDPDIDESQAGEDEGIQALDDAEYDSYIAGQTSLPDFDRDQLQQHIQTLEQKLARQKAKGSLGFLNPEQQQQLTILLERQTESDAATRQLKTLVERAVELNQQSQKIQQEIQGLNIVSENATNKCYEITYGAQHVIDQNDKLQTSLMQHLDRAGELNEQCETLAEKLGQDIEESCLSRQKMDAATDRTQAVYQKSRQLLDDVTTCRAEISEQANIIHQVTEVSKHINSESENLHKSLEVLKSQVQDKLDLQTQQIEVSNQVLGKVKQIANDIVEGKQETDEVLTGVVANNAESRTLLEKMTVLLSEGIDKQKQNRNLNLELQNSLHRNQQQREELTVLTSECREIRDTSLESQKRNDANVKESLERLSVSVAESKQNQLQAEHILKDVFDNNCESKVLIERMTSLSSAAGSTQQENTLLNTELKSVLVHSTETRDELVGLATDCRSVRDKSAALLETSVEVNNDSQNSVARLNEYMDSMCETKDELKELIKTSKHIHGEASDSLDSMRTNIGNSTLIQKECIRLNKESVTTTLDAKKITEKYTEELESSFRLNKHYQDRLKSAEKKYLSALEAEKKYQDLHETTLKTLRENEAQLAEAAETIKEYGDNTAEYNTTVKQFQQTTVQSQQIILETQSSIKSLISSNDQLTEENRFLKAQLQNREPATSPSMWTGMDAELRSDSLQADSFDSELGQFK
ncbi:MAG: chromosome segregation ATPase [Pseudohongiellaceae bacterium]|jgi:chromosome segregation ATPase